MLASASDILIGDGQASIISTGDDLGDYAPVLAAKGYEIIHIPYSFSPVFFVRIARAITASGCDVVHLHTERAAMWYSITTRLAGVANVRTIHNEFLFDGLLRLRRSVTRRIAAALGTVHIACSARVARNEKRRFGIDAIVIDNWIDTGRLYASDASSRVVLREKLNIPQDAFVAVSIGNEAPAKNIDALVEAIGLCPEELPIVFFQCGAVSDRLRQKAAALGKGRVHLLGTVSDIGQYLAASDVFVSASLFEGGQLVLMEAAAAGIYCITTRVGAAEEFEGLPNIRFIEPDAESVAEALEEVAAIPVEERERGASQLSEFARQRFVPEAGASRYVSVYQSTIDRNG
ncbi:glycosyltransferase [Sphingomonas oligophenolica]